MSGDLLIILVTVAALLAVPVLYLIATSKPFKRVVYRLLLWLERIFATPAAKWVASVGRSANKAAREIAADLEDVIEGVGSLLVGVLGVGIGCVIALIAIVALVWFVKTIWYAV